MKIKNLSLWLWCFFNILGLADGLVVSMNSSSATLRLSQPDQRIQFWLENRGGERYQVLGGTIGCWLESKSASGEIPRISALNMDIPSGGILPKSRYLQLELPGPHNGRTEFVEAVSLDASSLSNVLPGNRYPIFELVVDTTMMSADSGPWQVRINEAADQGAFRSFINTFDPMNPYSVEEVELSFSGPELSMESLGGSQTVSAAILSPGTLSLTVVDVGGPRPRLEVSEHLFPAEWSLFPLEPVKTGNLWRWDLGFEPGVSSRFFRISASAAVPLTGGDSAPTR